MTPGKPLYRAAAELASVHHRAASVYEAALAEALKPPEVCDNCREQTDMAGHMTGPGGAAALCPRCIEKPGAYMDAMAKVAAVPKYGTVSSVELEPVDE